MRRRDVQKFHYNQEEKYLHNTINFYKPTHVPNCLSRDHTYTLYMLNLL